MSITLHRHLDRISAEKQKEKQDAENVKPAAIQAVPIARRGAARKRRKGYIAVAYAGTRNLYPDMVTAAKSLICNSRVDKVYFLIEDDVFPLELPDIVECINVSGQTLFPDTGPNYNTHWTYMVLLRTALTKIFPELDKILSLDVDTIVQEDLSCLWDTDMGDCMVGLANEYLTAYRPYGPKYWNVGIMFQNLALMRETGTDDKLIDALNSKAFLYPEQNAINEICAGRIYELPPRYNDGRACGITDNPAIAHYVGTMHWQTAKMLPHYELLEKYRAMSWDDVMQSRKSKYQADRPASRKGEA